MSYCDFNNAFKNMDHKFLETFDGINSEDLSFNGITSEDSLFENQDVINSMRSYNARSEDNLNGTSIQHLNNNNSCNSNKNINSNNNKLTHRECIHLYLNPIDNKNPNYQLAQRHITICTLCQNEINKKVQESFQTVNSDNIPVNTLVNTPVNTPVNTLVNTLVNTNSNKIVERNSVIQDVNASNRTFTNQSNINTENKVVSLSMNELEILLKNITERTNNNDKYENFSKIIQKLDDNDRNKPLCIELNFMNIAICLLIILLLIDIVLRLKK